MPTKAEIQAKKMKEQKSKLIGYLSKKKQNMPFIKQK